MTTALLFALALQGDAKPQLPEPGKLISNLLAKYSSATTLAGEVTMTQSANDKKHTIKTNFQFERPNRVFIQQQASSGALTDWLVVSNGISFAYDTPNYLLNSKLTVKRERLTEPVATRSTSTGDPKVMKLNDILSASKRSLGDFINPFLVMTFQGVDDTVGLRAFISRISKMKTSSIRKMQDGSEVYVVTGLFQYGTSQEADPTSPEAIDRRGETYSLARFEMLIGMDMDLKKFQTVESIAVMPEGSNVPIQANVVTSWAGTMLVNSKLDESLFKLR